VGRAGLLIALFALQFVWPDARYPLLGLLTAPREALATGRGGMS
jgi:hypothetical protein